MVEKLRARTGLTIDCTHDDAGRLESADIAVIKESLFDWEPHANRIAVRGFIPPHPYLWPHLNTAMTDLGGRLSDAGNAWRPEPDSERLNRRWSELSVRQRFVLSLPTIGSWRPLDFLPQRSG